MCIIAAAPAAGISAGMAAAANASLAMAAVSTALSVAGSIQSGQAQKRMAEYNARIAEDSARYQAERQKDKVRRLMASARVSINKSGITTSGSPLDVLADSAVQAELDHQSILRGGAAQAGMDRFGGRIAQQSGYFGAATSLLSGASKAMGMLGTPSTSPFRDITATYEVQRLPLFDRPIDPY